MLKKNDLAKITITDIAHDGNGVGRVDSMAVFVPFSAVGDVLKIKIVKVLKSCAFAIIEEIIEHGDGRTQQEDCPIYRRCGSCCLRHLEYGQELKVKSNWVEQNLRRIGKVDIELEPIIPSPKIDRYRNKAIYPIRVIDGKVSVGFFARRSHRVEAASDCLLHPRLFADIANAFCGWAQQHNVSVYDENTGRGLLRSLYIRHAGSCDETMVTVIANADELPDVEALIAALRFSSNSIVSIILNVNKDNTNVLLGKKCVTLWGSDFITDRLCGLSFSLSPLSFYQVNRDGAQQLYEAAQRFAKLTGSETVLDLYCGAGTIGLSMAHASKEIIGVEIVPEAIENARQNAIQNQISNARFICADAAAAAAQLESEGIKPDVIILDPPRKGCSHELIETVVRLSPSRVVMVSCDSATCARDCAAFESLGYHVQKTQPVDMFPRTGHVETVVVMSCEKA